MSAGKKQEGVDLSNLNSALLEDRADRVRALKRKIQYLANEHSEVLASLTPAGRKRVDALREIQGIILLCLLSQRDELKANFFEERAALEAKYQKLYETLYNKRYEIVNGIIEVEGVTAEDKDETPAEDKASEDKGVPNFWLNAMKSNEILTDEIQERDERALKFLKDIKWCRLDDPKGFKLEFFFGPNPYFKNSVLTKTYHMMTKTNHMVDDEKPILEKAIGTEIEWLPGKCLTQMFLKQKPKKRLKNAKPITWDCESFFNFFNPPRFGDDFDEDAFHEIKNQIEQDYEIGSIISDKIIPHAVLWFTGEAVDYIRDGSEEDCDNVEDEDYEDEDDEEDDEEVDEEDSDSGATRKKTSGGDFAGERPAECKQQ